MEGDEKERESRSKAALCLWKREKKNMEIKDSDIG